MKLSFLFLFFALQACLFDESKGNRSASSTEANEVSTAEAGGYFSYYESYFQQKVFHLLLHQHILLDEKLVDEHRY